MVAVVVFGPILGLIADDLARMFDVRPSVIVVGHPVEDVEAHGRVGVDAALNDLDDVALADEDVMSVSPLTMCTCGGCCPRALLTTPP